MTAQKDDLTHEKGTMICDGRYKFIYRHSGRNEFYDLREDPGERQNLYGNVQVEEQSQEFMRRILDWYQQTCDVVPREYDSRFTEEQLWVLVRGFCPKGMEEQVKAYLHENQPTIKDAVLYIVSGQRKENERGEREG